jgi:hypothetical protein
MWGILAKPGLGNDRSLFKNSVRPDDKSISGPATNISEHCRKKVLARNFLSRHFRNQTASPAADFVRAVVKNLNVMILLTFVVRKQDKSGCIFG